MSLEFSKYSESKMNNHDDLAKFSLANVELRCGLANPRTMRFLKSTRCRNIAEIGVFHGDTSLAIARHLNGQGVLYLFDYEERVSFVQKRLADAGFTNVRAYGCSSKLMDSYNWQLMKLLKKHTKPIFGYVFIDGAHTWTTDGFAFLLVDRLLKVNGYVDFDDYNWTYARSNALNPVAFPQIESLYPTEQIKTPQVKLIVDLLVRRDPRYHEVVRNRIFRKLRP